MAKQEDIRAFLARLQELRTGGILENLDSNAAGMMRLLACLYEKKEAVSAGEISRLLCVSTARTAVLLKKCLSLDLIRQEKDSADQRRSLISLSEKGREQVEDFRHKAETMISEIMDRVGSGKMFAFLDTLDEIKEAARKAAREGEGTCWS